MPVSSRLWPDHRSYAALSTLRSDALVSHDGCAASARDSRCDPRRPMTPAGRLWHDPPPMLSNPPAIPVEAGGCMNAAQTPLQALGARARSGPFAHDGACGEAVLASTSGVATPLQPIGSKASPKDMPSASS